MNNPIIIYKLLSDRMVEWEGPECKAGWKTKITTEVTTEVAMEVAPQVTPQVTP
jgi:hypothetical protein